MTSKNKQPLVSVVMPVYNPGKYLVDAIDSILSQTFSNFEFIIVDDASTDGSWKIIKSFAKKDSRIIAFKNKINLGVSLTSNIAISQARGKYIARMDSDDVSTPDRLQKQVDFLKNHPQIIVVGGQCAIVDENNQVVGFKKFPLTQNQIKDMIFWAVPIQQGYMMVNTSLLPKNFTWYHPSKFSAEEVDLYFNLFKYGDFANLPDNLYFYRKISTSLSHQNPKKTFWITLKSRLNAVKNGFKPSPTAILINLIQIIVISLIPAKIIMDLWYLVRGVKKPTGLTVGTFSQAQV
ncbi:MAG TPA: glycosyltransferase family A protein [Candidatus Woesebacteria bacterium]|jgi:glycosyltransferase involved in cell wall biosynthesis|nr:glycosyltransferase family A protein [Candidatus Woesebacteria bacterium]